MAESKGALIAKSVQKHAGRAKEKLLQNLGKVDRTLDDIFEEHLQNFNRQHQQATRLQKEFNNYIRCIRAVQTASKSLMEAITEVYESGWSGHDLLYVQAQNLEMLWQDFSHKLGDQVLIPLNTYTNQFPEFRKKVEKRGRKLVDYDGQRHSFQNLQSNAAKRRDDVKVTKGREQLEEAKRTYEVLNSELHDELPALYDSRVLFYVNNLQTLFSAEQMFHSESHKVFGELEAITDKLANECQRGSYSKKLPANNVSPAASHAASPNNTLNGNSHASPTDTVQTPLYPAINGDSSPVKEPTPPTPREQKPLPIPPTTENTTTPNNINNNQDVAEKEEPKKEVEKKEEIKKDETKKEETKKEDIKEAGDKKVEELYDIPVGSPVPPEKSHNSEAKRQQVDSEPREKGTDDKQDEVYDIPVVSVNVNAEPLPLLVEAIICISPKPTLNEVVGATLAGLPPGALYRVRATYRYNREDSDELSFDVGEIIRVVEYDDPDEQEEGWLMGIKETTNEKGMFPANFTRPI